MAFSSSVKDRKDAQLLKDWTLEGGDKVLSRTRRGCLAGEAGITFQCQHLPEDKGCHKLTSPLSKHG